MKRILKFGLLGVVGMTGITYAIDSAGVAFPGGRKMYDDVAVDQVYTDTNRWHEVEYSRGVTTTERCVYSLFPHGGYQPCWYLKKHTMRVTNTD
jgi:hypothetical protein